MRIEPREFFSLMKMFPRCFSWANSIIRTGIGIGVLDINHELNKVELPAWAENCKFFVSKEGNVGIGTTNPQELVSIEGKTGFLLSLRGDIKDQAAPGAAILAFGEQERPAESPILSIGMARGIKGNVKPVIAGDHLGVVSFSGNNRNGGAGSFAPGADIRGVAAENFVQPDQPGQPGEAGTDLWFRTTEI